MMMYRCCERCGVSEESEMLAYHNSSLICYECDSEMENERASEDELYTHYLDTFYGAEERDI